MNWEITGNHYLCLSRVARGRPAIHGINVLHRGLNGLLEWRATAAPDPDAAPLLAPIVREGGRTHALTGVAWEAIDRWIPRFTADAGPDLTLTGTLIAPTGYDPALRGAIVRLDIENRGAAERRIEVGLEGRWAFSMHCVATERPLLVPNRLAARPGARPGIVLEAGAEGRGAAVAIVLAAGTGSVAIGRGDDAAAPVGEPTELAAGQGEPLAYQLTRPLTLRPRRRASVTFAIGAAPERDGALATATDAGRTDADTWLQHARLDLARIVRRGEDGVLSDLLNRNLAFVYACGVARAIDDDRLYPVASRSPDHGPCAIVHEAPVLQGTLPAITLAAPWLGRELLMRMLELYSDRAGQALRYVDGGVFSPGFALDGFCSYVLALDAYIEATGDASVQDDPLVQDVLREMDEVLWGQLHADAFLCRTERTPSGEPADLPYLAWSNVLAWRFCGALDRLWRASPGEPPARFRGGADDMRAAFWQHFVVDHGGVRVIAGAIDLAGAASIYDDPAGSLIQLPALGFCDADDPLWTDTMELLRSTEYPLWHGEAPFPGLSGRRDGTAASLAALCAAMRGQGRADATRVLRSLDLPGGLAVRAYDTTTGRAARGPYAAAEAGLLAHTLLAGGRKDGATRGNGRKGRRR
jgi:hypothetical protein